MSNRSGLLLLLAGVLSCNGSSSTTAPPPATVTVTPTTIWGGGAVLVRSAAFKPGGTGATIQVGGTSLILTRVDDSTMTTRLPNTVSGTVTPTAVVNGVTANLNALTVYGFAETVSYEPLLSEDVYVWPRDGHARIMGSTGEGGGPNPGLAFIDLDTHAVSFLAGIAGTDALRGPGATYQDSIFLLRSSGSGNRPIEVWRLLPTPTLLESHPEIVASRQAMRFGPNAWFTSGSFWFSYPGGENTFASEPEGVFMSPRHDRATITIDHAFTPGVPVFNVPSGTLAYSISLLSSAQGVDFSPDGELLAIAGGITGYPQGAGRILLLNAATGAVIHDTTVDRRVFAVAIDPVRPLLYVGLISADDRPVVLVLDRNSFKTLGEMAAPTTAPSCFLGCYKGVIALSNAPALYVFWGFNGESRAYRFTMPVGSGVFGP